MSLKHVIDQLPLWVEGDLGAAEALEVGRHLETCPACRTAADALRASQAWLKAAPEAPFDATVRAQLRAEVMARVRAEAQVRNFRIRAGLAAAAAVLLALAGSRLRVRPRVDAAPPQASTRIDPPTPPVLPPRPEPPRQARPRIHPEPPPIEAPPALARIEIQTSNPAIRIIWLASARPAADPPLPLQENP